MFHWRAGYSRPNTVFGRGLRQLVILSTTVSVQFAYWPSAQVLGNGPSGARSSQQQQFTELQSAPEVVLLELGKSIEREISGGKSQIYQVSLTQGQYAKVAVEQRGVDIVARVLTADGHLIAAVDSERTRQGEEKIELVADAGRSYKIEIVPSLPTADAGTYAIRLIENREATSDEKLLYEARKHYYESLRLNEASQNDKAIELASRALATREKILGTGHTDVATSLLALGASYWSKGDYTRAEDALQRALDTTAKISGTETLDYADVLHALARVRFSKGEHEHAEQLNLRALSIREKAMGPDSLAAASSFQNLAVLYRTTNDLPKAEQLYLRALAIREKLLGPDHAEVSILLNNLGLLYYGAGDYDSAEPILQRSLAIKEKVFGPIHRQVGIALNNLGLVEWKRGAYEKAEAYHRRAMRVYEKVGGPESFGVGSSFHNLGIIYKEAGKDYPKAEEYYQRALAIWEKIYGEYDASIATALSSLGILYEAMGDYDRALKFHLRAQSIYERVLGPNNHYTLLSLRGLADVYAIKGDIDRSMEYQRRISAIEEKIIPLNLTTGSERQKIAYFTQLQKPDRVISFHVRLARDDGGTRDLAATKVLQRKGRVLDALSESRSALRRRFNPEDQALLDSLGDLNSRLARLVLSGPQKSSPEEHQNQVKALEGEREKLEAEISRRSAGFYEVSQPVTLATVRAAVPPDSALIEFAAYRPVDLKAADDKKAYGAPRYVAYVIRKQGEVRWTELGEAKKIDDAITALRQALRDPARGDVRKLARAVDEKLMQPVRALVGDATQLLISPDGELNLIPFATLVDEQGRYLVERYALAYLTSGRDLLRLQTRRESKSPPVVVADPAFGEPALVAASAGSGSRADAGTRAQFNYSKVFFGPLPGIGAEVRALKELLPQATFLTREQATEATLKRVSGPSILHVATHGFFLENDSPAGNRVAAQTRESTRLGKWVARVENPLLRSGLALAGANHGRSGDDDGVLTALEATTLDLWGTKLVVLSACDTGVGEVKNGDGVYGLRRALFLAGAESQLMSLWPVSDRSTRDLMAGYYQALVQNAGRGEALRKVQLKMLRNKSRSHPYYWASFILAGEWANLKGQR
jgi:CHAT domain-containing protein/Tfp pilus assembly protein PilF